MKHWYTWYTDASCCPASETPLSRWTAVFQVMAALSFLLPCETNEKVGLEITVLLSLAVMQLVILGMIPASSETLPLIGPLIRHQGYVNYGGGCCLLYTSPSPRDFG